MTLHLRVKPGSKVGQLFFDGAGLLNAKIKALAQNGRANAYLITFLANRLRTAKSNVMIVAGFTHSPKRIELDVESEVYDRFLLNFTGK